MEKSENFEFNLPSSDSDDIVDVNQISDNFRIIDTELYEATQNASKEYVDNAIGALADDVAYLSTHAATKQYVDDAIASGGGGTGGGGVSSWNDLTDKPFYDEGTKTATLDYANPPAVSIDFNGVFLGKVTDDLLTADHINGANLSLSFTANAVVNNASQELNIDTLQVFPFSFGTAYQYNGEEYLAMIAVAEKTGEFDPFGDGNLLTITEAGTYLGFVHYSGATQNSMSLEYDFIKTLDIKFIPNELYTEIDQRIAESIGDIETLLGGI